MKLKVYNQIKETLESLNQLKDVRKSKVLFGLLEDCRAELIKMMRKSFDSKYEFLNKEGIDVNEFISFLLENSELVSGMEPEIVYIIAHGIGGKAVYVDGNKLLELLLMPEMARLWNGDVKRRVSERNSAVQEVSMAEDCLVTLVWDIYFHYKKFGDELGDGFWENFNRRFFNKWKEKYPVVLPKHYEAGDDEPANVYAAIKEISKRVEEDVITVVGNGSACVVGGHAYEMKKGQRFISNSAIASMGYDLPAAIGATFGRPDRTVCVFMGDGGLQMNLQELGTIMEQKAPVKMILLNNNFLGNVRQWQAMFFNRRYSFTPMMNPDYMKIASAYDIPARRVMTREELAKAIDEMIATDGPFLLEACVEEEGNVMPMTPPGGSVNQMLLEC